ncbi:phosphoribosyltransferase [Niveispirillum sp. KHB5.9]|uniref:phosphoribosyltransferase n=1 Tax=Niveispirillum sp. KHB5.9 TaxID=3400269 RepID=UPI003A8A9E4E
MTGNSNSARRPEIVSFDRAGFDAACAQLMRQVLVDFKPDALIGIRTGGLYVADAMARSLDSPLPVLSITCRRASTAYKERSSTLKSLVTSLPRPIVDKLRVLEHVMLTRRPRPVADQPYHFDPAELALLDDWLSQAGDSPSLLVVDDAIDTGATLSHVMDMLQRQAPQQARIKSAVITVTTRQPLIQPWYSLYDRQLCRFPWSLDA